MASKRKTIEGPFVSLNQILLPLNEALRQSCGRKDLTLNEIDQTSASKVLYALTGTGAVPGRTDRKCILNQLFPKSNPELWLGVLLELRKQSSEDVYEILHVSIQAFEGTTSQTIEPLLRAEWDSATAKSKHGPAQPHWHAYSKPVARPASFMEQDRRSFEGTSFETDKQRQHKVHFALCANWHKKGESHFELLKSPEELKLWIMGALNYIKAQL